LLYIRVSGYVPIVVGKTNPVGYKSHIQVIHKS
jgi:hypothetical protein